MQMRSSWIYGFVKSEPGSCGWAVKPLYKGPNPARLRFKIIMCRPGFFVAVVCAAVVAGCAGPEKKLGRGINNVLEFTRGGEIRRSMEQTALWDGTDAAYTTGFLRGFNRSMARTFLGAVEVLTFPVPPYEALYTSTNAIYPDFSVRHSKYPWGAIVLPENPVYPENSQPSS